MKRHPVRHFISRMQSEGKRRAGSVRTRAMGRERTFHAWDLKDDTFIFEDGIKSHLGEHASVLMVEKSALKRGAKGRVLTITTGNHSVAAIPLLGGQFWSLSKLSPAKRGKTLVDSVLCANVVGRRIEVSQRDVPTRKLVALDRWLVSDLGFGLEDVQMVERNDMTLTHFRQLGQEWRVKPLAWTPAEMRAAVNGSRKRISTRVRYYHSAKGVHFLSYSDFSAFVARARDDYDEFVKELREMTGVFEGSRESFLRQTKFHGHHEIELFGLPRGYAIHYIVPLMERVMESITLGRIGGEEAAVQMEEIASQVRAQMTRPTLTDDKSPDFIEFLYMHLTGEVYSLMGDGASRAFDDRRTALPGATYVNGRPVFHKGVDARSEILLSNLRALMSRDEYVEYANVYELRTDPTEAVDVGAGRTREVVYKTNRSPLVQSLVEKRLSHRRLGYANYVLTRVQAFKNLGMSLAEYRLLKHRAGEKSDAAAEYFIRTRCEGWPMMDIPSANFQVAGEFGGADAGEDPRILSELAFLLGDAAAQTMIMKKYDPVKQSCYYGVGKEIFDFDFDIRAGRLMPTRVSLCSVRGSFGWPDTSMTEENLEAIFSYYTATFARTLVRFANLHPTLPLKDMGESFLKGFEYRSKRTEWIFSCQRESFESFEPQLKARYHFKEKWLFALWALERQVRRLGGFARRFESELEAAALEAAAEAAARKAAAEAELGGGNP